jgi:hypothetical protein
VSVVERGRLEDGRLYAVLEVVDTFCPLGIRFWDAALDDQVREGLVVRAWPVGSRRPVAQAYRTRSDVYAFQGLPGLQGIEGPPPRTDPVPPDQPVAPIPSPAPVHEFVVEVVDRHRRFVPVAFGIDLPLPERGLYLGRQAGSPSSPPGFYLFSSPVRQSIPGVTAVRGELVDSITGDPAPHALIRADIAGHTHRYGLADDGGRFAVAFPPPPLTGGLGPLWSSPDGAVPATGPPITERSWDVAVSVFWEPAMLDPLPGTVLPDYGRVLHQAPAEIIISDSSPASSASEWLGTLEYGNDLVVATPGTTQLLVASQGSPP